MAFITISGRAASGERRHVLNLDHLVRADLYPIDSAPVSMTVHMSDGRSIDVTSEAEVRRLLQALGIR